MRSALLLMLVLLLPGLTVVPRPSAPAAAPRATEMPRPAVTVVLAPGYEGPTVAPYPAPLMQAEQPTTITATWQTPRTVEIAYSGGSLWRNGVVWLGCCAGTVTLTTRAANQDAAYVPAWGDTYEVRDSNDRVVAQTTLGAPWRRWLGVIMR